MTSFNNNFYALTAHMSDLSATAGTGPSSARFVIPFGGVVVSVRITLDGAITTTAYVSNFKVNGGASVAGNGITIAVAASAADAVYGGNLLVPIEVAPGDTVCLNSSQAAGSAQSARCTMVIRR